MTVDIVRECDKRTHCSTSAGARQGWRGKGLLEVMVEPWSEVLARAPAEEEELNDETIASIPEARRSYARNGGTPHD